MNIKELRLDVEALLSQVVHGHGFLHYGYWPEGKADKLSLERLGKAQQDYFNRMLAMIPGDVRSILDVGSGTGSNAKGLLEQGYAVDCLCPSPRLNMIARRKLEGRASIFECGFENFASTQSWDLVLCCESFHYIRAVEGLRQAARYANKYLLIFDYFRVEDGSAEDRITYEHFLEIARDSHFRVVHDEDVTQAIAPTFLVLDTLRNTYVNPFIAGLVGEYRQQHPFYALLMSPLLKKLENSARRPADRYVRFPEAHEYRLVLMSKES